MRKTLTLAGVAISMLTAIVLTLSASSFATPPQDAECPAGTELGPTFEEDEIFVGSTKDGVTITDVEFDEDGEIESFSFVSERPVGAVLVKAGRDEVAVIFDPPVTSGTVTTPTGHAISHVHFCFALEPSPTPTESPSPTPTDSPPPPTTTPPPPTSPPPPPGTTTVPPPVGGVETGGGSPDATIPTGIGLFLLAASLILWRLRSSSSRGGA